jgi:hypothetical protein
MIVDGKAEGALMAALDELWFTIHGPSKELITDGVSGIVRWEVCSKFLERQGVRPRSWGEDQHARLIERCGALLRDTVLRVEGQLKEGGIELAFEYLGRGHVLWKRASVIQWVYPTQRRLRQGTQHPA